jgi:hypothetical protein
LEEDEERKRRFNDVMAQQMITQALERFGVLRTILLTGAALGFGLGVTVGMAIGRWSRS